MLVTKSEFKDKFGFNQLSSVTNLVKKGTIVADSSGMIDLEDKKNKKWIKARKTKLISKKDIQTSEQHEEQKFQATKKAQNAENQLELEIQLLNQKLAEKQKKSTLLDLRIAKEQREVIETDVLNKVIMAIFNSLFQNLTELPSVYVDDIINIIKADKNPKENLVKFLTEKIISQIRSGLETAENTAKKYYEKK